MFVQIKQHLFAFEHALGEGAGFIHLALVVNRVAGVKIMRGIDVELPLRSLRSTTLMASIRK